LVKRGRLEGIFEMSLHITHALLLKAYFKYSLHIPAFYQDALAMKNTENVVGRNQSIALDIHGRKVLFFCSVQNTTRNEY
jgi:hypothetical protein